jgi:two-component system KDP operon response regulator KdpE
VVRDALERDGYAVSVASDGREALEMFREEPADLVVTDLAMPNLDGLQLCRRLREVSQIPIIVLSVRGEEKTKVEALDAGADDYVTKPFGMDELLARIRAALRRSRAGKEEDSSAVLEVGDFRVDLEDRSVTVRGREVRLTPKEYELMVYLVGHPGKVLTHRTLLASVWGGESSEQTEYLRVFVGQLRKKVEPDTAAPRYILTEPWIGYRFDPGP